MFTISIVHTALEREILANSLLLVLDPPCCLEQLLGL